MTIQKIVITGGPCGGKTTALTWIANNLPQWGIGCCSCPRPPRSSSAGA